MLMYAGIAIGAIIVFLVIFVVTRPDTYRLERSTLINAPGDIVFEYIDDFHKWTTWSPWEKVDTDLKCTYTGSARGTGAEYGWEGKKTGQGTMRITDSRANERIDIDLRFIKPFASQSLTEFTFAPQGDATHVTWAMSGNKVMFGKVMDLFGGMDKMVGKDFDKGLRQLKSVSETDARMRAPAR